MTKQSLLKIINQKLEQERTKKVNINELNTLVLDTSRVLDKKITVAINKFKKHHHCKVNDIQHAQMRLALLGYPIHAYQSLANQNRLATPENIENAYKLIFKGISRSHVFITDTLIARYKTYYLHQNQQIEQKYLKYIQTLQQNHYQMLYLNISANQHLNSNDINHWIKNHYNQLSNYHNCVITFRDTKVHQINWDMIAKVAIFMENFKTEPHFPVFNQKNRNQKIKQLINFISNNPRIRKTKQVINSIKKFYQGISYGFQFKDLYISQDTSVKTLIMQKVQFNPHNVRCPSCFSKRVHSNSYPQILFKSFECVNPKCPARSKSGRGKRFTYLSAKRKIMLKRNSPNDRISHALCQAFRKDIVPPKVLKLTDLLQLYTWSGDKILAVNCKNNPKQFQSRIIKDTKLKTSKTDNLFNQLPIVKLFKAIHQQIKNIHHPTKITNNYNHINQSTYLINDNSDNLAHYKQKLKLNINSAITSPPYYNARQYSHWSNVLCYFIDMMINAQTVYDNLDNESVYIYNVGDIINYDYIYVNSQMSKCKIMLGFYSALLMKTVGFRLINDIIWDKGEVQSHRNSSSNHFAGYLEPINCYEHDLVLYKGKHPNLKKMKKVNLIHLAPVKKINSKGQNTYGHSAPFPIKLAELILPYAKKNDYILDSFVGSGTTCKMAHHFGYKSVGFEINLKYYQLAKRKLK